MTDTPAPDAAPPPASPYGPADGPASAPAEASAATAGTADDGVEQLFGDAAAPTALAPAPVVTPALSSSGDSETVARARRTLGRLALALPLAGLALSIAAIVVQVTTGGSIFGIDPVSEAAGFSLTFLGPTLLVLGLHMIVWRAMARPLSRMSPGTRVGMIIGVGGVLSFLSVILVFILVFAGFILVSGLLSATDQAM